MDFQTNLNVINALLTLARFFYLLTTGFRRALCANVGETSTLGSITVECERRSPMVNPVKKTGGLAPTSPGTRCWAT